MISLASQERRLRCMTLHCIMTKRMTDLRAAGKSLCDAAFSSTGILMSLVDCCLSTDPLCPGVLRLFGVLKSLKPAAVATGTQHLRTGHP